MAKEQSFKGQQTLKKPAFAVASQQQKPHLSLSKFCSSP